MVIEATLLVHITTEPVNPLQFPARWYTVRPERRTSYLTKQRSRQFMTSKRALISGAGVAGPALAFWLERCGVSCTIVERAPSLREGGQAVDFRGPIHRAVLERMGIWKAILERRTRP